MASRTINLDRAFNRPMAVGQPAPARAPLMKPAKQVASRPLWMAPAISQFQIPANPNEKPYRLYKLLRDNIPPLSRALQTYCALLGDVEIVADDTLKEEIEGFLNDVRVGPLMQGFRVLQGVHVRNHLLYGMAAYETVPNNAGNDIYGVLPIDPETLAFKPIDDNPMQVSIWQTQTGNATPVELPADWTTITLNDAETDPYGVSMFRGLPFVGEILLKLEECEQKLWELFGVPSYHVNMQLPEGWSDPDGSKTTALMTPMQTAWAEAQRARRQGNVRDFHTAGEVTISVIGADSQAMDFQVPFRAMMEQIVSATGLPPWMLGFTWSTTERLSDNQADVMTQTIKGLQSELIPAFTGTVQRWLDITGRTGEFELQFCAVNLHDAVAGAQAKLNEANAMEKREAVATKLWTKGIFNQEKFAEHVLGDDWDGKIEEKQAAPTPELPQPGGNQPGQPGEEGNGQTPPPFQAGGCVHGVEFAEDARVSIGGGEKPKYKETARAIDGLYSDILAAFAELQKDTWAAFGLPRVKGAGFAAAFDPAPQDPFTYTPEQMKIFNRAVDQFVERMMGRDLSREGFLSPDTGDGIIQQWDRFAYAQGINRAVELGGAQVAAVIPDRNGPAVKRLLGEAFDRLSDNGQMRIGSQLDGLRDVIQQSIDLGRNPLETAEEMAAKFNGYRDWEWQRLARTEVAFAENKGLTDEFKADGYTDDLKEHPPYHPNCVCAVTINPATMKIEPDIAATACPLCQAYVR